MSSMVCTIIMKRFCGIGFCEEFEAELLLLFAVLVEAMLTNV